MDDEKTKKAKQATIKFKEALQKGEIEFAPDDKLKEHAKACQLLVAALLEFLGGGPLLISDESSVRDFPEGSAEMLSNVFHFPVGEGDLLVDVVRKIAERENPQ